MTTSKITRIALALFMVMGIGQAAFAQGAKRWVYLGQTTVNGERDYDRIGIGRSEGRFQSIQLRVEGGPVEFQRVVVNYSNGTNEEIEIRDRIPAGGQTRAIDLRGGERSISSVEFRYGRANWSRRSLPRVSLYGLDIIRRPEPWSYLGQASVSGSRDRDIIGIGRNEGRFHSLQLRVAGGTVEFHRVVVHYSNGASEEVEVRDRIPAGGQTRAIDLRGGERTISNVEFFYGNANFRGARVSLYGR
ncbi:MAG TPA: hypothetical protein VJ810_12230 [Blastocatellia bacterium]|nr:hypothetical protein [Blastocatellia bacterium]